MPTVAKNIKDAIAETEKNKNNLVQAKTKIDNKIQNLGGQKPTNIFDIANKIEGMVNTQYKKIAMGTVSNDRVKRVNTNTGGYNSKDIKLNINFVPKRIIITDIKADGYISTTGESFNYSGMGDVVAHVDTDNYKPSVFYQSITSNGHVEDTCLCRLKNENLNNKTVTVEFQGILGKETKISYKWIAIG